METIKILILCKNNLIENPNDFSGVDIRRGIDEFDVQRGEEPDIVFVCRNLEFEEMEYASKRFRAYTVFFSVSLEMNYDTKCLYRMKCGMKIDESAIVDFIRTEAKNYYSQPYGEKFQVETLGISPFFEGDIRFRGHLSVDFKGNFGSNFQQIAYFQNCIPIFKNLALDFWLEYEHSEGVEISLVVTQYLRGSLSTLVEQWEFSEEELKEYVSVDNSGEEGMLFFSIRAKGEGFLSIIALHDRYSRRGHGYFMPGGRVLRTPKREEVFAYFDPGDLKPPLNVYFSGYKTREGFEGYRLFRKIGSPFLLLGEARLTGGAAYLGDNAYEKLIITEIRNAMRYLKFKSKDVIMSGLSMGASGALYYASDIMPKYVVVGKPLINLGNVAKNEKYIRPGGFSTSLDWLYYHTGEASLKEISTLNDRFIKKFEEGNFSGTAFAIAYMIEDDYDRTAYEDILGSLNSQGVEVYGKGIHGRHNDATPEIVEWFERRIRDVRNPDYNMRG